MIIKRTRLEISHYVVFCDLNTNAGFNMCIEIYFISPHKRHGIYFRGVILRFTGDKKCVDIYF